MMSLQGAKQILPRASLGLGNPFLNFAIIFFLSTTPCQAAIEFDGINDYIIAGRSINLNSNKWTLSLFANFSDVNGSYDRVLSYYGDGPTLWKNSGSPGLYIVHSGTVDFNLNISPTNNTWNHISVTRNGSTIRAFQNGFETSVNNSFSVNFTADTEVRIGNSTAYNEPFNGKLDDVRIYERPMTNGEILALYNSRSKRPSGSLANGLIAHYEMDDDAIGEVAAQAKDSSGNLNHGRFIGFDNLVSNGFSNDVPTQIGIGQSLEFDGVDDYISTSAITNSVVSTNNYSMSIWIKPSGIAPTVPINQTWLAGILGDSGGFFSIGRANITGEGDRVYTYNYPGIDRHVSAAYNINEWTHLVTVQNGGNLKFYKDNNFIGSIASSGPSALPGNILIGRVGSSAYNEFTGSLDDAYIYNRALTASEISFLYNGSGLDPGTSNLQALWTFDDDSALKDSSGNNNHGVGVGGDSLKYSEGVLKR